MDEVISDYVCVMNRDVVLLKKKMKCYDDMIEGLNSDIEKIKIDNETRLDDVFENIRKVKYRRELLVGNFCDVYSR